MLKQVIFSVLVSLHIWNLQVLAIAQEAEVSPGPRPVESKVEAPPVGVFAQLPRFDDLEISPGGTYLAARVIQDNRYTLNVFDLSGDGLRHVCGFKQPDTESVAWFRWANPERLLISLWFSSERGPVVFVRTGESRLFSMAAATCELTPLFFTKRGSMPVQFQDEVVSFLPEDPDHILLQYSKSDPNRPRVYKANVVKTGGHVEVMRGRHGVTTWLADAEGDVRLGGGLYRGRERYLIMRLKGEKEWRPFHHRVSEGAPGFLPVGFAAEPDQLYVLSNHEGDPNGLYLFDIARDEFGPLIFRHESVDIDAVGIEERTAELRCVSFVDDEADAHWFSTIPIQEKIGLLRDRIPGQSLTLTSVSDDGEHAVLWLSGERGPGRFVLYNSIANRAKRLMPQYTGLEDADLGLTMVTEYAARDGLRIPAFVTLPPGMDSLEEAKAMPFVIYPHGGPAARDFLRFRFDVQFLASRGYGVLQMNFRGSAGYGREFEEAGHKQWGQAMQDDITDGAKWLVEKGYADPDRLAIMGGSYGGYAALMGAVKTPELYQCAISFAGVTDLPDMIRHEERFIGGAYSTRFIGNLWRDRKMLALNSPARRVKEIQKPILLMHGDRDTVVDIAQSKLMAKDLKKHGKRHKFLTFEDGDHHLSLYRNRLRFLTEIESFLGEHLGTLPPESVPPTSQ